MEDQHLSHPESRPRFLVLAGDGINCERETALAFELAGAAAEIVHINDLLADVGRLDAFHGLAIPGGFSFGDELGSGQLLALKIRHGLGAPFRSFIAAGRPVIGICNGFQVLVKLGLLPWPLEDRVASLASNEQGTFIDRWTGLNVCEKSVCLWTRGIGRQQIELPIRHGEGRLILAPGREETIYARLRKAGQIPLTYSEHVNGSYERIAALCDPTGLVFGLMPHPEAFLYGATDRRLRDDPFEHGDGFAIFRNIVTHLQHAGRTGAGRIEAAQVEDHDRSHERIQDQAGAGQRQ